MIPSPDALAAEYRVAGWWTDDTLSRTVRAHARTRPDGVAFVAGSDRCTWSDYDARADALAAALLATGVGDGDRVAVLLPDGVEVHVAFLAVERAGAVVVGIGWRAGDREIDHLVAKTRPVAIVTTPERAASVTARHPLAAVVQEPSTSEGQLQQRGDGVGRASTDVFLCNSTSGTTGLPKVVVHNQARWFFFHRLAVRAADLGAADVFCSAIPAPFGFGLWTAHFTPTILGAPCVVLPDWSTTACLDAIEAHRVTVLACVSTQLVMLLTDPTWPARDLSSLRAVFTGGEMVPYAPAAAFEDATGAAVLQFYGSNETGALSGTTLRDPRARRLRTAGRVVPEMRVRLVDDDGRDVTASGRGIAACRGATTSYGYLDDDDANAALFTPDGWMRTGDVVEVDADGWLTVVGRASDVIIRGGKNISAAQVEDEVGSHPAVALAAAVAAPDALFGERVCVFVELVPGAAALDLDDLRRHLAARGVGKDLWPERLVVLDALPRSSGGKVAKGTLRRLVSETAVAPAGTREPDSVP